jgi:sugar O-acyltransferase (sialic acid O-acetyltransferase NeuD family)
MSKLVIFGTSPLAECVHFYFTHDSPYEVVAFTAHREHLDVDSLAGLPTVPFEEVVDRYPPSRHQMFVAVSYRQVNHVRAGIFNEARTLGYLLASYVSSKATHWGDTKIGANTFIFEDNTIQPFVEIGDDTILWSGNHIGHHSKVGNHCFITSQVVISGLCTIGDYSFIGVNATLRDGVTVGHSNVIGSGSLIMKDTRDHEVYAPERTRAHRLRSDEIGF